jgi:hypothetical protein
MGRRSSSADALRKKPGLLRKKPRKLPEKKLRSWRLPRKSKRRRGQLQVQS